MSRVVLTSLAPTLIFSSLTSRSFSSVSTPGSVLFTVAGPKGDVGINWRGDYNPLTAYIKDDAVSYNGSSYLCEVACKGVTPGAGVNWSIIAAAGGELGMVDGGVWTA